MDSWRARAFRLPPSLEVLRRRFRERGRFSSSGKTLCSSSALGAGDETREESVLSILNAPKMVWVAVPRRRRGFIGGTGGALTGEGSADPGGRPTRGTLAVDERKVGSEISLLFTGRLVRDADPKARWEFCEPLDEEARDVDEPSVGISFSGGVALAE